MGKREELITKLGELRREFEGFPEEQKVFDDTISELSTKDARVTLPFSPEEPVPMLTTDLLLMARTLSAYCRGRPCDGCVFNHDLCCPSSSWLRDIDAQMLAEHGGEEVTVFYPKEE